MAEKTGLKLEGKARTKTPQPLVAHPVREAEGPKDPERFRNFFTAIASYFPGLRRSLSQANMHYTPAAFVQVSMATGAYISVLLLVGIWLLIRNGSFVLPTLALLAPVVYFLAFNYVMLVPSVKAKIRAKLIEQELVFAGRHMLIELKSGIPLFDAMLGISRDYGEVSVELNKVVEKVTLGVPLGQALHEVAENDPSQYFRRVVLQMANSLASGSDVALSLEAALDQIAQEQIIELKAYGQKLNPMVMFFMIFAIIMPSLGVAFLIILSSFLGGTGVAFGSSALFGILVSVALIQFLFLSMVENSRPKFDIVT